MKKNLLSILLVAAMLLCSFAFAEVDTSAWETVAFENLGISLKLPAPFYSKEDTVGEMDAYSDDGVYLVNMTVTVAEEKYDSVQAIYDAYSALEYLASIELKNINGVDVVVADGADDWVLLLAVLGADGNAYRFEIGYNLSETGEEVTGSEDAVNAMVDSLIAADQVPADSEEYTVIGETGVAMKLPGNFITTEGYIGDMNLYDEAAFDNLEEGEDAAWTVWLQVTTEDVTCTTAQEIVDAFASNEAYADVKIETINGVEVVTFKDGEACDGKVKGFFMADANGLVYRFAAMYECDGIEAADGEAIAEAIVAGIAAA